MKVTWHADSCGPAIVTGQATFAIVGKQLYAFMSHKMLKNVTFHPKYRGASAPGWVMAYGVLYPWCLIDDKEEDL